MWDSSQYLEKNIVQSTTEKNLKDSMDRCTGHRYNCDNVRKDVKKKQQLIVSKGFNKGAVANTVGKEEILETIIFSQCFLPSSKQIEFLCPVLIDRSISFCPVCPS